jgi:hypothetical protein
MDIGKINQFLHAYTGAKFFEKDKALFISKYPHSPLIKDLGNAGLHNMAILDERICAEMLMHNNACIDCIWENRGFYVNSQGLIIPLGKSNVDELTDIEKKLLAVDFTQKVNFNTMKKMVFELKLEVPKHDANTYAEALQKKQAELMQKATLISEKERLEKEADIVRIGTDIEVEAADVNTESVPKKVLQTEADQKKSAAHDTNTQE